MKETMKMEAIPLPEPQQTTVLNGAKSTGELHLQNGEKASSEKAPHEVDDKNPHKEPHS